MKTHSSHGLYLRTHSLDGINNNNGPITQSDSSGHLRGEVHMTGRVDQINEVIISSCNDKDTVLNRKLQQYMVLNQ